LTQVPAFSSKGRTFEYQDEQEQCDREVHCEGMEPAQELGEFGSLSAIRRNVDQQDE
jgi:hypothetical protein